MENTKQPGLVGSVTRFLFNNKFVNTNIERLLTSLSALSLIGMIFTVLYLGAFIYKMVTMELHGAAHFKFPISGQDLIPVYNASPLSFYCIFGYEVIKLLLIFGMAYYFWKFAKSIDNTNPFCNPKSRNYISAVATLALFFFPVDVISSLQYNYFGAMSDPHHSILGFFHWEYLFGAYFINVFAIIFRRGADLNNEMDLVI